jgi:hypothetical protein
MMTLTSVINRGPSPLKEKVDKVTSSPPHSHCLTILHESGKTGLNKLSVKPEIFLNIKSVFSNRLLIISRLEKGSEVRQ